MRKNILTTLAICSLAIGISSSAFASLNDDMVTLAKNLNIVQKSDNPVEFKAALVNMRAAAQSAQKQIPPKLEGKATDSDEMKDYQHGFSLLVEQLDNTLMLVDEGKLKEAKVVVDELVSTRNIYHKKYR